MDPDGLSILIATASTFGALAAAYRAGAVSASEPERQQSGILGFSDRMAGLCAAFVFACGFFVYGFLRIFAQAPGGRFCAWRRWPRWPCCCTALAGRRAA